MSWRLGYPPEAALALGRFVAESSVHPKARRPGMATPPRGPAPNSPATSRHFGPQCNKILKTLYLPACRKRSRLPEMPVLGSSEHGHPGRNWRNRPSIGPDFHCNGQFSPKRALPGLPRRLDYPKWRLVTGLLGTGQWGVLGPPDRTGTDSRQADKAGTSRRSARGNAAWAVPSGRCRLTMSATVFLLESMQDRGVVTSGYELRRRPSLVPMGDGRGPTASAPHKFACSPALSTRSPRQRPRRPSDPGPGGSPGRGPPTDGHEFLMAASPSPECDPAHM